MLFSFFSFKNYPEQPVKLDLEVAEVKLPFWEAEVKLELKLPFWEAEVKWLPKAPRWLADKKLELKWDLFALEVKWASKALLLAAVV